MGNIDDSSANEYRVPSYHKPLHVIIVIMIVIVLMGMGFAIYIYKHRKNENVVKEYRGIHNRPDINYVRVTHTDIN